MADETVKTLEDGADETLMEGVTRKVFRKVKVTRGKSGDEDSTEDEEIVEIRPFATTPARATARVGVTMCRSYQSISVHVEYSIPEYREFVEEAGEEAYERAKQHLMREIPEMREFLGKLKDI
jgi:hypothetical protein